MKTARRLSNMVLAMMVATLALGGCSVGRPEVTTAEQTAGPGMVTAIAAGPTDSPSATPTQPPRPTATRIPTPSPNALEVKVVGQGFTQTNDRVVFAAVVENPNGDRSAEEVIYEITAHDAAGKAIGTATGSLGVIFPEQR